MPIMLEGEVDNPLRPLTDYQAPFGEYLSAKFRDQFANNPMMLLHDAAQVQEAESGQPAIDTGYDLMTGVRISPEPDPVPVVQLNAPTARDKIKQSGVDLKVPDSGIGEDALNLLIQHKQDEIERQTVLQRSPSGARSIAGFGASLAAGILDPLNIAAGFVPVIGEERYAALLANASGAFGRAGVRAGVGALEGAVGTAAIEPLNYLAHHKLQDDYGLVDSLQNIAFGSILGGGLHVGAGAIGDALHGTPAKTADLRAPESAPEIAPMHPDMGIEEATARMPNVETRLSAPFTRIEDMTPDQMRAAALRNSTDDFRAELLAEAGNKAEPGAVAGIRSEIDTLRQQMDSADVKAIAKQLQQTDKLKFKDAMAAAEKQVADQRTEAQTRIDFLQSQLDGNATAARAEQDLALLNRGEVPERFADRIDAAVNQMRTQADIAKTFRLPEQDTARYIASQVSPETRNLALRSAVAQAMDGRMPDIEPIIHSDPAAGQPAPDISQMRAAAEQQALPESRMTNSKDASIAADQRLKTAPKDAGVATAEQELQKVMDSFSQVRQNLEQGGLSPQALREIDAHLQQFDDLLKQADELGNAARAAALCGVRS